MQLDKLNIGNYSLAAPPLNGRIAGSCYNFLAILLTFMLLLASNSSSAFSGEQLSASAIKKLVVGKTVSLNDGSRSYFAKGGRYVNSKGSTRSVGNYFVRDGLICITFSNGYKRCSIIEKRGESYVAITLKSKDFKPIPGEPQVFVVTGIK